MYVALFALSFQLGLTAGAVSPQARLLPSRADSARGDTSGRVRP